MPYLLLLLTLLYTAALIGIALGVRINRSTRCAEPRTFISVIVAARNESAHILALCRALAQQAYPPERYEVLFVDDASTDDTARLIETFIAEHPGHAMRLIHSQGREQVRSPKKHALAQGIAGATGEILLFTDADCIPPATWVQAMASQFDDETGMVIGFSPYEVPLPHTLLQRVVALESLSLAALAAGTTGYGRPATCSGRNLAYRKCVFEEVGGFAAIAHFVSGDDDLFLKLVHERTPWKIRYALDAGSIVPTRHLSGLKAFVHQRLRHASKGFYYGWRMTGTLMLAYGFNLLLLVSLLLPSRGLMPWVALGVKGCAEFFLLGRFALIMKRSRYLAVFPLAELLHIPYVVFIGALGPLLRIRWKEKRIAEPMQEAS